jgi:WD40 repeat protein
VTAGEDGLARVYDAANGILGTTMPISASTKAAVISTDGELVATAGNDGTARIWNATSGVPSLILAGNGSPLASVAFNSTGTRLATTAGDGTIRLWSIEPRHKQSVRGAVFDARIDPADRNVVGIADVYRQPYLWYMDSGTLFPLPSTRSNGFAFSNNGSLFVTTTRRSGKVPHALLWNTQQPDHPVTSVPLDLRPNDSRLAPMTIVFHHPSFSPDQKSVVFATSVGAVIWRPGIHTGNPLSNPFSNAPGQTVAAAYSPDGREIVTGGPDGLSLWQVPTNKLSGGSPATPTQHRLFALKHAAQVVAAAFSSGGHFVASGDTLGRISVWSVASGKVFHHIRVPAIPTDLWFSPRGRRLLISATDGTVRVWDWKNGIFLAPLQLHAGATRAAQYVPGHPNEILSAGDDGLVEISECPTCVSIPALEDLAKRHFDRLHTHKPR